MVKVVAIGGGGDGRPGTYYETGKIDRRIVEASGKKHPEVLFISPPDPFQEEYFKLVKGIFTRLGCRVSPLFSKNNTPDDDHEGAILGSDIIYVGGGNTLRMMQSWRKLGIDEILLKAADKDIVLSGLSAGAICWFKSGCSDSMMSVNPIAGLIKVRALGIIRALYCPHHDPQRGAELMKLMKRTSEVGLAFDDRSAIEIVDDGYRIIASDDHAKAYKVYWKSGTYHRKIIKKNDGFSPLGELLGK